LEPPDPIPNSEVKQLSADDSVGLPHVKVGHCQVLIPNPCRMSAGVFYLVQFDPGSLRTYLLGVRLGWTVPRMILNLIIYALVDEFGRQDISATNFFTVQIIVFC
jgi:hypothetical protein